MKNKKILIIAIIIIVLCAIGFGVYKVATSYLFRVENGKITIEDGKKDLINHLKGIEDREERKKQIDFSVEHNIITQKEAEELY